MAHACCRYRGPNPPSDPDQQVGAQHALARLAFKRQGKPTANAAQAHSPLPRLKNCMAACCCNTALCSNSTLRGVCLHMRSQ